MIRVVWSDQTHEDLDRGETVVPVAYELESLGSGVLRLRVSLRWKGSGTVRDFMLYLLFGSRIFFSHRICGREESFGGEHFEASLYVPLSVCGVLLAYDPSPNGRS